MATKYEQLPGEALLELFKQAATKLCDELGPLEEFPDKELLQELQVRGYLP